MKVPSRQLDITLFLDPNSRRYLNRLIVGSPQVSVRKLCVLLRSWPKWEEKILLKMLRLLFVTGLIGGPGQLCEDWWDTCGTCEGGHVSSRGLGGVGELDTSLSCPLSSEHGVKIPDWKKEFKFIYCLCSGLVIIPDCLKLSDPR